LPVPEELLDQFQQAKPFRSVKSLVHGRLPCNFVSVFLVPAAAEKIHAERIADRGWPSWAHPVVSGGRLYIRNQGVLTAYDVTAR
jgi:hypothetical protein